jgi:hypothetical protein
LTSTVLTTWLTHVPRQQSYSVNIDLTDLLQEADGDFSDYSFLSSMVDANAAVSASAIAGLGVNLGLGIRLTNGTVTPYITGINGRG